jgi:cyanophycinase
MHRCFHVALTLVGLALVLRAQTPSPVTPYKYIRVGSSTDAAVKPHPGFALMGGGKDLDEAFQWLCGHAIGGDFLVLRATGTDAYNPYIQGLCKLNSVATLIIPTREAASDPFAAKAISHASVLFIAGGDQANYINFWMGTPVQDGLNDAIKRGVPVGGTSAGLAVMGEFAYSAQADMPDDKDLDSKMVLANPYDRRVTLVHDFLNIPLLHGVITDSHFAKRDRLGRLLGFLARLNEPESQSLLAPVLQVRGIGIGEGAAVLINPNGKAAVVGHSNAYFLEWEGWKAGQELKHREPLSFENVSVQRVAPGHEFKLENWKGSGSRYTLSAKDGEIHSTQADGAIY